MVGGQNKEYFVGSEAVIKSDLLNLRSPIENGGITNWEDFEKLIHHTFFNELLVNPEEHAVVFSEKPLNPRVSRERAAQLFFETFNVKGYYSGVQAVMSLFSVGQTTGLVWDAGDGISFTVPIYEGYALPHAIIRSQISGQGLTKHLYDMVSNAKPTGPIKLDDIQKIKETDCRVVLDYQAELQKIEQRRVPKQTFNLSDGVTVPLGAELFQCPEILFSPSIAGLQGEGIHQQILSSLERCDGDVKKEMYSYILLTGGTSMFRGLPERTEKEIVAIATAPSLKIKVVATPERKISAWFGGSILGTLGSFPQMMVDRQEYQEEGVQIIHYKSYNQ